MIWPQESQQTKEAFERDIANRHLVYFYNAKNPQTGADEKWKYEMWFHSHDRIVYHIHGGPMAGRINYQKADYQCIRAGELWQCNWLEETGTICSLVYDIPNKKITTLLGFSKGHWEEAEQAHGDKRNPHDLARWRKLAEIGKQTDRHLLHDQADIAQDFRGSGDLEDISYDDPVL
ncbi:uncharacterized protein PFL1_02272 [Pseudozyma flocculosa PF-1]|uniref:Phenol acid carboxylase n=1 Tax=Pseudozyma flocculosa TaxID=84751 RepID=A0A5C3F864_9BASI|nr:uncharacterized protein PFL1_02272 [Pseudozyma flocculosa PF-1]EPQ30156.1 hypothetical protein PFL1_02272 [Pseudozyma flocculosa PF-1]SPO39917.1 uncharacterized protein PSFLO_05398 [Pseudozyma flocculosa]